MEWLKRNGSLALGIGLPALLVVFFLFAALFDQWGMEPPRYDVLYLTNYRDYEPALHYQIRDGHVVFERAVNASSYHWPKLYRYSPSKGSVTEIPLSPRMSTPRQAEEAAQFHPAMRMVTLAVPELENVRVSASSIAPDGYEFRRGNNHVPGLAGGIFFSARHRYEPMLVKNSHVIRLSIAAFFESFPQQMRKPRLAGFSL